jgi:hypothetical protein
MNQAVRQGDVYIRPTSKPIIATESKIDWVTLRALWDARLKHLHKTNRVDRDAVIAAVSNLYISLNRPVPTMSWFNGSALEPTEVGIPIRGLTDLILQHSLLHIPESNRVLAQLSYDINDGDFRITRNKRLLSSDFRLRARSGRRPPWTRDLSNMISQFDIPALVLYDLALSMGANFPAQLTNIAENMRAVFDSAFAVILFENRCILLDRPLKISLDPSHLLSATLTDPATMTRSRSNRAAYHPRWGEVIFAVGGIAFSPPGNDVFQDIMFAGHSARIRTAMIDYIGWEHFFDIVPKHLKQSIDRSKYGELWDINLGSMVITVIRVTNATAEPDGSFRKYVIPVDPMCRPLPNPNDPFGQLGQPQERTALNAVASTFGVTGSEYAANRLRQS